MQKGRFFSKPLLALICAVLIALSLFVFQVPSMFTQIAFVAQVIALICFVVGIGILFYLIALEMRSTKKISDENTTTNKSSGQISVNISLNCNVKNIKDVGTFLKELSGGENAKTNKEEGNQAKGKKESRKGGKTQDN